MATNLQTIVFSYSCQKYTMEGKDKQELTRSGRALNSADLPLKMACHREERAAKRCDSRRIRADSQQTEVLWAMGQNGLSSGQ
jgi:hypothetical protein